MSDQPSPERDIKSVRRDIDELDRELIRLLGDKLLIRGKFAIPVIVELALDLARFLLECLVLAACLFEHRLEPCAFSIGVGGSTPFSSRLTMPCTRAQMRKPSSSGSPRNEPASIALRSAATTTRSKLSKASARACGLGSNPGTACPNMTW